MRTLIIDLEGSVSAFKPVKPFWYPLQDDGSLYIIAASDGKTQRQKGVAMMLDWLRADRRESEWQMVILSASPPRYDDSSMYFVGCLTDRLRQIQNEFLAPLSGGHSKPFRVVLLDLYSWVKDELGVPVNERGREQWNLDTRGYVEKEDADSPLFSAADVQKVAAKWSGPKVLNDVHVDQGLSVLEDNLQKTIRQEFEQAKEVFADLVKTREVIINTLSVDYCSRFLDLKVLSRLNDEFSSLLEDRIKRDDISWIRGRENPLRTIITDLLQRTYSALSASNLGIVCIRFPNGDRIGEQQNSYRSRLGLLRLAYFLIFLCEQTDCRLDPKYLWVVDDVDLDTDSLDECFIKTISRWKAHARRIEKQWRGSKQVSCLQTVSPCGAPAQLNDFKMPSGLSGSSIEGWQQWLQEQKDSLDTYGADADVMLAQSRRLMFNEDGREKRRFNDLDETICKYEKNAACLRRELHQKAFKQIIHDWPACVAELSRGIGEIFVTRLSGVQRLMLYITALSLLLIPYLLTVSQQGVGLKSPRVLVVLASQATFVIFLDWMLTRYSNFKKKRLEKKVRCILHQQGRSLKNIFENNKFFQQKICEFSVLIKNLQALKYEKQKKDLKRKKLTFFKKQFDMQCDWLSQFVNTFPPEISVDDMGNYFVCQVDKPPAAQKEFWVLVSEGNYIQQVSGSLTVCNSCHLPGLRRININCPKGV